MISDSEANFVFVSDLLEPRYPPLVDRLRGILGEHGISLRIIKGTQDIWCRDYMPVQVAPARFVRFRYAPDYLVGYEDTITDFDKIDPIPEIVRYQQSKIVLDGGNVVRSGKRAIVTDKLFHENAGVEPDNLLDLLQRLLNVDEVIVIPQEPGDEIGHADGIVRFLDAETVFINDYSEVARPFGRRLQSVLRRASLKWIKLPYSPVAEETDDIPSAVGCYANFLMVRGPIVIPTFGTPEDEAARQVLIERAPQSTIESIDCLDLAQEGGVLNCVTWSIVAEAHSHQQALGLARRLLDVQDGALVR
jgi:agmatine deiminase